MRKPAAVLVLTLALFSAVALRADAIYFHGFAQGCFAAANDTCTTFTAPALLSVKSGPSWVPALQFNGASFSGTSDGSGAFGPVPVGEIAVAPLSYVYNNIFRLAIQFTEPEGLEGTPIVLNAVLKGNINRNLNGVLEMRFEPTQTLTFSRTSGALVTSGTFDLSVDNLNINTNQNNVGTLIAHFTNANQTTTTTTTNPAIVGAVPEPENLLMLGTGLFAVGTLLRRKIG